MNVWEAIDLPTDPVPGSPGELRTMVAQLRRRTAYARRLANRLQAVSAGSHRMRLRGDFAVVFRQGLSELPGEAAKIASAYAACADILHDFETLTDQTRATTRSILSRAVQADMQYRSLLAQFCVLIGPVPPGRPVWRGLDPEFALALTINRDPVARQVAWRIGTQAQHWELQRQHSSNSIRRVLEQYSLAERRCVELIQLAIPQVESLPDAWDHRLPRYERRDLRRTGQRDRLYRRRLFAGPDDKNHFIKDRMGAWRTDDGRLRDSKQYVHDDNKPPRGELSERAVSGHLYRLTASGNSLQEAAVRKLAKMSKTYKRLRDLAWDREIAPVVTRLGAGLAMHRFSADKLTALLARARPHLSNQEYVRLATEGRRFLRLQRRVNQTSERLGSAGGSVVVARDFSDARPLTGATYERGTAGNLDRTLYRRGSFIAIEEKGGRAGLGQAQAPDPRKPNSPEVTVEQGSALYLRKQLEQDSKLGPVLRENPELWSEIQSAITNGGRGSIRYLLVRTNDDCEITVREFVIDPDKLRRGSIRLVR
ncbi:hypothetical protein ACGFIG_24730 [Micromonospora sp. NPDC049048]|uniref:hypothetical protein n=1 Tax=Micromonospora sp. NPDC049048 TaxID=3364263 RepID=UPI0037215E4E